MVIFKTLTSLTPKQILKAGLIFSFLSAALLVANAKVPQAYFTSLANILRLIVALILTLIAHVLVFYVVAYFGEPFVFAYELITKKIPLAWPIFRPLTPLDITLFTMLAVGVFFALSLKNYLGREKRTLIWWLAAWMTLSFFLLPLHSLLQSSEPETPAGPKDEVSQNQSPTFDGHYAGPNDSFLDVETNAEGVVSISGHAYWNGDKTTNTGEISGPITITNGQALYKDGQCLIDLEFTKETIVAKERVYGTCGGLNVSFDGKYTKEELAIKLLSTAIPAGSYDFVEGRKADCQPEFFDPKITKFHKVKGEGTPSIMYYLDEDKYTHFMVNGWENEGEEKIILLPPYDLNFYEFGCASSSSYVLELSKNNQREALYTHAVNFNISPDKKYLYLDNNVLIADGKWEKLRRIINIESQEAVKLPNMDCVSGFGFWNGGTLITYSNEQEYTPRTTKTKVCFWSSDGNLRSRLEAHLDWFAGARFYLDSPIGILPKGDDTFYAFIPKFEDNKCFLILQDLGDAKQYREFEITENDVHCPRVDFDLNNLSFESKAVRFRLLDCSYDYDSPGDVEKCDWKEWQEGPKLSPSPETPLTKEQDKEILKEKTLDELGNYEDEFLSFRSKPNVISKMQIGYQEGEEEGLFGVYPRYRFLKLFNSQMKKGNESYLSLFPIKTFSTVKYFSEPIKSLESLLIANLSEEEVASKYKKLPYLPPVNAGQSSRSAFKSMSFKNGRGIRYIATFNQDASPQSSGDIFYTFQGLTNDGKTYLAFTFPLFAENFDVMKENFEEEEENISQLSPRTSSEYYSKLNELHNSYLEELTTWVEENLTSGEMFPLISDLDNLVASLLIKDFKEPEF